MAVKKYQWWWILVPLNKWITLNDMYKWYIEKTVASEETENKSDYDFASFMDFIVWYKTEFEPKMASWCHLNVKLEWWTHLIWYDERTSATIPLAYKTLFYFSLADIEFNWPSDDNRAVLTIKWDQATNDYSPSSMMVFIDSTVQTKYVDFNTAIWWYTARKYCYVMWIRAKLSVYSAYFKDVIIWGQVKSYFYSDTKTTIDFTDSWFYYWYININNCYAYFYKSKFIWKNWVYTSRFSQTYFDNVDSSWLTWSLSPIEMNVIQKDWSLVVDNTGVSISYKNKEETITAKKTHSDDIEISDSAKWIILTSPWWTKYRIKVDDDWVLSTEAI